MLWQVAAGAGLAAALAAAQGGTEIGFVEEFALATNRDLAIQQLVPGTDEFYFYTCLQLQNTGQAARVGPLLTQWVKLHGETERAREIRNRQMLLTYRQNPQATLDYLRREEGLAFNHAREQAAQKNQYPARLDPALTARDTLAKNALGRPALSGFTDAALEWLATQNLSPEQRRALLQRLADPDIGDLPDLIVADLKRLDSGGFGSLAIHGRLTLEQLNACAARMPELAANDRFVEPCVRRLRPPEDSPWTWDPAARRAYLDRLWGFVEKLPASQNSLKAHVLHHRLAFDRTQDAYDRDRFLAYLKLPRNQFYVKPLYRQQAAEARLAFADLGRDYEAWTGLKPVGDDESLVRDYLARFLADAPDYNAFAEFLDDAYVKEVFAETKLLAGVGSPDQWYNLLPPAKQQALRDRVDLALLPQNPSWIGPDEPVKLRVAVKNVPRLTVQVFEIDAFRYFQENDPLTTAVDLDGLAPGTERVLEFREPALRRHVETIDVPAGGGRGVCVVELIGGGVSSRAVIRRGRLVCSQRVGAAGHVFTVFDEKRNQVKDARLWVGGTEYGPDKDGRVTVPFTTGRETPAPMPRPVPVTARGEAVRPAPVPAASGRTLVRVGAYAEPVRFDRETESYRLDAGFWLDREALVAGGTATVVVRPALLCAGRPADLALLEETVLEVRAVDAENVASTQRRTDLQFDNRREYVHAFAVPEGTRRVELSLRGKVRNLSMTRDDRVADSAAFACNGQDAGQQTFACYLRHLPDGWRIEVRGKSGEPRAGQVVNLRLKHRDFTEDVRATLQTDDAGRLDLGPLDDLVSLGAAPAGQAERTWTLQREAADYDGDLAVRLGQAVELPLATDRLAGGDPARAASLYLLAPDGSYVADERACLALEGRTLALRNLPAGRHRLRFKDTGQIVSVAVYDAPVVAGLVVANTRVVETGDAQPARIVNVGADDQNVRVQVAHATPATRVHVLGRWSWSDGLPAGLAFRGPKRAPVPWGPPQSLYVSGRNIGDEYRYILERRFAARQAGNMLDRPSLLLTPWSTRETVSERQAAQAGDMYQMLAAEPESLKGAAYAGRAALRRGGGMGGGAAGGAAETLDFLPGPALVAANLAPDKDGIVSVPRAAFGFRGQVYAVLCDGANWACRELALPDAPLAPRDRCLRRVLAVDQHLVERNIVTPLAGRGTLTIEDVRSTRLELYDSIAKAFRLFQTLHDDASLREFAFVTDWPKLPEARKRELYAKYACHELDFFLFRKDKPFFDQVVKPFLAQKKDKQLVDDWLLGRDLGRYLEPWAFGRLNFFERILLAQRLAAQQAGIARHVRERYELLTPDPEEEARRFLVALQGGGLEQAAASPAGPATAAGAFLAPQDAADGGLAFAKRDEARAMAAPPMAPAVANLAFARKAAPMAAAEKAKDGKPAEDKDQLAAANMDNALQEAGEQLGADRDRREKLRQMYRSPDTTKEWVETHYYRVPLGEQTPDLVPVNAFWNDFAAWDGKTPFLSPHVTAATGSFTEMLLALAVLDLPFEAGRNEQPMQETRLTLKAGAAQLAFHLQTEPGVMPAGGLPLLVGQSFFAADDRFTFDGNERFDKFVTGEFLAGRVYGARIVLTNPTSARRKVQALLQIPEGAVPVQDGFYTRTRHVLLEPYATQTLEYYFYFPAAGQFRHYPVHASLASGTLAGFAPPAAFQVVAQLTKVDDTSWPYVSQHGTDEQVLAYLAKNNVERLDLARIAFRMRDKAVFGKTLDLLRQRRVYSPVLWSYGILHRDEAAVREYLRHAAFAGRCGQWLASDLLDVDAAERWTYEHKEYWPLVNARVYQLGARRRIMNDGLAAQYRAWLDYLCYRPAFTPAEQVALSVYLLLQDRVTEAAGRAGRVKPADVETALQLDYLNVYLAFARAAPDEARKIAARYLDYPVARWRDLFANAVSQADEIAGGSARVSNRDSREEAQDQLAATAPSLELTLDGTVLTLRYRNLSAGRVSYYPMDLELLFSRNPFVRDDLSGRFSLVQPARSEETALPAGKDSVEIQVPGAFKSRNLLVQAEAGGITARQVVTPHSLDVRVIQSYGQVLVRAAKSGKPLPAVYVKVYARFRDGAVAFYKDGYTDLRGRFDYASLSTDDLDRVERFALLVMSDDNGAVVRETTPPGK
jgi:hypothetical protein